MVKIEPFDVEKWMDKYEVTPGVLNIAETCAASISIDDLVKLCEDPNVPKPLSTSTKLTYGPIRGSLALRERLASLYSARVSTPLPTDNILITPGAIAANFLVFYTLIGPSDHVICVHPTYQQLYDVPKSLGAEVSLWKLRKEKKYVPDLEDLKELVKDNTKMIIINNPNNPTGATIPKSVLQGLVKFARERDIIVLSDEVYRPLFHGISPVDEDFPPSLVSLGYAKTIITGSMSKAYSLAGIRLGWIASRDPEIIEAIATARDYTTISVSQLDDQVATYALSASVLHALLGRNIQLAKTNCALLERFIDQWSDVCSWVKPNGGTTALVRFEKDGKPVEDVQFCIDVIEQTKVMFLPASKCFGQDFKGYVRIGFVCETEVLKEALKQLSLYVRKHLI
ncbi:putative aspartate aminotransferase [Mollisia scopiformis]|uniref:Putative aspartate aminotransferase n=1 Tax=Mollisia scopiformis TaxID=149040 RepID=A0A194XF13_MOLSC|nr:putative aspartate aminotransferase [Mollisia scopiformis]KUJ18780.1 putative aspartate aminotransferase [Mollisia scopiformis]